ncbi:MAG: YIP1 family protein [Woeseia sp.]
MSNEEQQRADQEPGESPEAPEEGQALPAPRGQPDLQQIPAQAIRLITNPVGFYQGMAKSGGLVEPLIFMVVLAVVAGVLSAVLSLAGFGMAGAMAGGLIAIILVPVFVVIFGFVGAAIAYVIWKMMGSQQDFETAFRCVAYTAAIAPVTAVLNLVPYIGSLASALWPMALLAIASIHVHRRSVQVSWAVFGIIGVILAFISVSGEYTSRQLVSGMEDWQEMLEQQRQ